MQVKMERKRIVINSVGSNWAKGTDIDHNYKPCSIQLNKFFTKEMAKMMIGNVVSLNCEVSFYQDHLGLLRVNVFPLGDNGESAKITLNYRDQQLKKKLELLREKLAYQFKLSQKKYLVFSNETLMALVEKKPLYKHELLNIHGIGETRYYKYGIQIMKVIGDHLDRWDEKRDYYIRMTKSEDEFCNDYLD